MSVLTWIAAIALLALPVAGHFGLLWRSSYLQLHYRRWLIATAAGAAAAIPINIVELLLLRLTKIDLLTLPGSHPSAVLFSVLVAVPLEMAAVTLVARALWRMRRVALRGGLSRALETQEGVAFATSTALGFGTIDSLAYLWLQGSGWWSVLRAVPWPATFTLLCGIWGYVLGRYAGRGMRSRSFSSSWLVVTVFAAVADQLLFRRNRVALFAVAPLLLSLGLLAVWAWRDNRTTTSSKGHTSSSRGSLLPASNSPSLDAIREAFQRRDRPIKLSWIIFGALVTSGLMATGVVAAVFLAHKLGLDFSAVERTDPGADALAPLTLLGLCVLAAFPVAGYLLARASGTHSVMEPAMAASLAMVLVMVFMGLAAPVSIVFAVAFSPVAFALSCIGAWMGL